MKTFTPTEFRADSSKVYNAVMVDGFVAIDHRDRPRMILMTEDALVEICKQHFDSGFDSFLGRNK